MGAIVVGGGISGVACAAALHGQGVAVELRERSLRLGGRMASRTLRDTGTAFDGRVVDIGASYFTASDPHFAAVVSRLESAGVVRPWTDGFHVAGPAGIEGVTAGPMRFAAPGGLRSVVEALAQGLPAVSTGALVERAETLEAGAVALCMPSPQAARIASALPQESVVWQPVLAVTCVFDASHWVELDGVFVNDDPVITWIADDGSRRGDGAPVLVAHVEPVFSARHLDDPKAVIPNVVSAIQRVLGFREHPDWVDVHRWTYAKPTAARAESFWISSDGTVALAGDAFADGPRVETAWLSGHRLGLELAGRQRQ